jgi:hypothetical protein
MDFSLSALEQLVETGVVLQAASAVTLAVATIFISLLWRMAPK